VVTRQRDPETIVAMARKKAPSTPVRIPKAAEVISDAIRGDIVRGDVKEGESLPSEAELMEQFQVSRPTIREAVRILESESLIQIRRGSRGGAKVQIPNESAAGRSVGVLLQLRGATVADIWDARVVFEPPLAGRLAKSRTAEDLSEFDRSIDEQHGALEDSKAFVLATARFHYIVVDLAGNSTLALLASLLDETFRLHATEVAADHSEEIDHLQLNRAALRDHTKLVRLIRDHASGPAETFWRRHLQSTGNVMLQTHGASTVLNLYRRAGASDASSWR
jgi:DNA-binding FadR family transcriptional regulator